MCPPTEAQLRQYKADMFSDDAIGALHDMGRHSVKRLRLRYGIAGLPRSEAAKAQMARKAPPCCQNPQCGRVAPAYKKGLCPACYEWKRTKGTDRTPQHKWTRQKGEWCKNCEEQRTFCKNLCISCYYYWKRNGRKRPKYYWTEKCIVCGRPRQENKFRRGRCHTCWDYWHTHKGIDRSPELIAKKTPFGWCECGKPAVEIVTLRYGGANAQARRKYDYSLCQDCIGDEKNGLQTK